MSDRESTIMRPVDWRAFATYLVGVLGITPVVAAPPYMAEFSTFLALSAARVLPSDVARFLQETAHLLAAEWLLVLRAGRQSQVLWDLRTMSALPARTPLDLDEGAARWRRTVLNADIDADIEADSDVG